MGAGSTTGHLGAVAAPGDYYERAAIVLKRAIERDSLGPSSRARVEDDRLTVCHVFSGDLWAGAEVVILNLLSCLNTDPGLRILALSMNEGVLTERLRAEGVTTHVVPEAEHTLLGIVREVARLLEGQRVDILHSHRYKENAVAWLVARRLGIGRVITTIHGVSEATTDGSVERWWAPCRRWLDYALVKRGFSAAVAVSDEMKGVLVGRYGLPAGRVCVIRNGGRFPAAAPVTRELGTGLHLGTVSRLVPVKGLDLFLDVAAAVARTSPSARFSILGEGPLREPLERRARALGLAERVQFLAPRPDPFAYYRSLDVYLNTSLHEGLPLSIVEAMACGIPVVSAAVGGIPEIVEHGQHGYLVAGRDPGVFAGHCLSLLHDEPRRRAMGKRGAATAHARLSAPAMATSYRELYWSASPGTHGRILGAEPAARPRQSARARCED